MPSIEENKVWAKDFEDRKGENNDFSYYGQHWGDPNSKFQYWGQKLFRTRFLKRVARKLFGKNFFNPIPGDLSQVVSKYIQPYIHSDSIVLEIGPGGGRWTSFMLKAKKIILVELNTEFFSYLNNRFPDSISKFEYYQTRGDELEGIESDSVTYAFTFGTFVHLEPDVIQQYLIHLERVLKVSSIAVIQYADKTKDAAKGDGFSIMNSNRMETFIQGLPTLVIEKHDTKLLNHSNIIVIKKVSA